MSGVVQLPRPKIRYFATELRPFLASSKQFFRLSHFGATAPSPRIQISAGQLGGRQCPKWGTDRRILGRLAWPAGLARWLSKLGCRAGLSSWAVRLSCPSPRVAVWLAGWPGRLAGLPGLACPPAPPSPPDATTGATGKLGIGSQTWPEGGAGNAPKGSFQGRQPVKSATQLR